MKMLLHRSFVTQWRESGDIIETFVRCLVIGVIIGILYTGLGTKISPLYNTSVSPPVPTGPQLVVATLFFFLIVYLEASNDHLVPILCERMVIYRRELKSFSYGASAYWLVHCIEYLPVVCTSTSHLIFIVVVHLPIG